MAADQRIIDVLRKVECFSCLSAEALRRVAGKLEPVSVDEGDVVCREGESGDAMFIVTSGTLRVSRRAGGGEEEATIAEMGEGEVFGVMTLFDRAARQATVRAEESAELYRLDADTFQGLMDDEPAMATSMLSCLARRLRHETHAVESLRAGDTDRRPAVAVFDTKPYTEETFVATNRERYVLKFFEPRLGPDTAGLAAGFQVVCAFVNDVLNAEVVEMLADGGTGLIAMRCAGYNNVDLEACIRRGVSAVRVPAYSPHAVAEHATALMLGLNRHIHRAAGRIREGNFSLKGLIGFDMHGKTVGVIGTGKIGAALVGIMRGFGCRVLAFDKYPDDSLAAREAVEYVELDRLLGESDIISLHVPLTPETRYLIDVEAIDRMKSGVMLINTSRGGLVDTRALIDGLKSGKVGSAGLDVYEEESEYFFEDFSDTVITDDVLARLTTFNNVLVTSHQGFLTREALQAIAETTLSSVGEYVQGRRGKELTHGLCEIAS